MRIYRDKESGLIKIKEDTPVRRNFFRIWIILYTAVIMVDLVDQKGFPLDNMNYLHLILLPFLLYSIYFMELKMSYKKTIPLADIESLIANNIMGDQFYFLKLKNGKVRQLSGFENYEEKRRALSLLDDMGIKKVSLKNKLLF